MSVPAWGGLFLCPDIRDIPFLPDCLSETENVTVPPTSRTHRHRTVQKTFERSREHENLQKNHERTDCSRKDRPCDLHTADPGADCGKRIFP